MKTVFTCGRQKNGTVVISAFGRTQRESIEPLATMTATVTFQFGFQRNVARRGGLIFIKGNHEDFVWLDEQPDAEVLPGLF